MLKENNKTLKQIDKYIRQHTPNIFSRGCGKSEMILKTVQINYGLWMSKDVVRNATEYISFEEVLKLVINAIYQSEEII